MRKHAETFHANKGCKLAIVVVFISTLQNTDLWYIFQTLFARKLSFILHENNKTVFSSLGPVFPRTPLFMGSVIS